jgi:hypothetical protein
LAWRQREGEWTSESIAERMDLGGAAAAADAERLDFLPPLPPVAQRCAFTWVLSSSSSAGGLPVAASAWKSLAQSLCLPIARSGCRASCVGRSWPVHRPSAHLIAAHG